MENDKKVKEPDIVSQHERRMIVNNIAALELSLAKERNNLVYFDQEEKGVVYKNRLAVIKNIIRPAMSGKVARGDSLGGVELEIEDSFDREINSNLENSFSDIERAYTLSKSLDGLYIDVRYAVHQLGITELNTPDEIYATADYFIREGMPDIELVPFEQKEYAELVFGFLIGANDSLYYAIIRIWEEKGVRKYFPNCILITNGRPGKNVHFLSPAIKEEVPTI